MEGGGDMCDSGRAQSNLLPEPGPLGLTWVAGEPRAPVLSYVQSPRQVLSDRGS